MRARCLGRVFGPEHGPAWMASHAAYPTPVRIDPGRVRVFFIARDVEGRGTVGWVDVSAHDPTTILAVCETPALGPGVVGSFDDRGVGIGNVVACGGRLRLYYMGWNVGVGVPVRNAIGLALSTDATGTKFERAFAGPVLDRSRHDPYSLSYPFVTLEGSCWSMIYGSHRCAATSEDNMQHALMLATSADGIDWHAGGSPLIPLADGEIGHSRPWLLEWRGKRCLLFSARRDRYEIATAWQVKGEWARGAALSFEAACTGSWDGEARCYASHLRTDSIDYLFYNGNGYGRTGFGVAVLEP